VTLLSLSRSCCPTRSSGPSDRKARSEPGRVWTAAQLRAFLDTAGQHRLFAFYRLAAYTGARRGELLNLRWRDIDLDLAEVRITGSAAVIAGQRIEGATKSGRSRTVSIDPDTVQVLRDHHKRQAEERLRVGPEWRGTDDYVFSPRPGASRSTPTRCRRS
jgi:integrase